MSNKNLPQSYSSHKARDNYLLNAVFDSLKLYGCNKPRLHASNVLVQSFYIFKKIGDFMHPALKEWANNRNALTKLNNPNNPKHAGRNILDPLVLFYCYLITTALALSDLEMEYRLAEDLFIKSILCAFCGRKLDPEELPSARSLTKYSNAFAEDGIVDKLDSYLAQFMSKMSLGVETDPARQKGWEEFLKINDQSLTDAKLNLNELNYGMVATVDSAFIGVTINHLSAEDRKLLQQGKTEELTKKYPYLAAVHKRLSLCSWGCKYNKWYFGVKLHVLSDAKTGFVLARVVTGANASDATTLPALIKEAKAKYPQLRIVIGDAIYGSQDNKESLSKLGISLFATNKKQKGQSAFTEEQSFFNRCIGRTRCFVEHVFSFIKCVLKLKPTAVNAKRIKGDCHLAVCLHNAYRIAKCYEQSFLF